MHKLKGQTVWVQQTKMPPQFCLTDDSTLLLCIASVNCFVSLLCSKLGLIITQLPCGSEEMPPFVIYM